jgi:hypothetical protein
VLDLLPEVDAGDDRPGQQVRPHQIAEPVRIGDFVIVEHGDPVDA